jgi:hypothetical protein
MYVFPMLTDAQSNLYEVGCDYNDHESHGAHGGSRLMILASAEDQPTHHEIVILGH